ncbi:MAG: ankyrin repeat domain-containing protein, partial [Legionella sp.]
MRKRKRLLTVAKFPPGDTPLDTAVKLGDLQKVEQLLNAGVEVNPRSILYDLIAENNYKTLTAQLNAGMDPTDISPLCAATEGRQYQIMELLLNHRAQVNQLSPYGKALERQFYACSRAILMHCADKPEQLNKFSALHIASLNDDLEAIKLLLRYGADVNLAPYFAREKKSEFCKQFMNLPLTEYDMSTPLHVAALAGKLSASRCLIAAGANVNKPACGKLMSTTIEGVYDGFHLEIMPLHRAAAAGHPDIIDLLLDSGANINAETRIYDGHNLQQTWKENTALGFAVLYDQFASAQKLISRGANLNNWVVYMEDACARGNVPMMDLLYKSKRQVNPDLTSCLQIAIEKNKIDAV